MVKINTNIFLLSMTIICVGVNGLGRIGKGGFITIINKKYARTSRENYETCYFT
jgi:hypothetical protein